MSTRNSIANFHGAKPVIPTASVPQGADGPLIPEIHRFAPAHRQDTDGARPSSPHVHLTRSKRSKRMIRILGISGSLRAQSYNTALLQTAQ